MLIANVAERYLYEVVELTQNCELGKIGERAIVVGVEGRTRTGGFRFMSLVFFNRPHGEREASTGADYRFLRTVT